MPYGHPNTYASNPGGVKLSPYKWELIKQMICQTPSQAALCDSRFAKIADFVQYGDTQPALVMSVSPLIIAAYSDEMDAVMMLRFPEVLAKQYRLRKGKKLVTVNTYRWLEGHDIASDLFVGENYLRRYSDCQPVVPLFLSNDVGLLKKKVRLFDRATWRMVAQKAQQYADEHPGLSRNGFYFMLP